MISIVYCVNLVGAQGRNPKYLISNPTPAPLRFVIRSVSNYKPNLEYMFYLLMFCDMIQLADKYKHSAVCDHSER